MLVVFIRNLKHGDDLMLYRVVEDQKTVCFHDSIYYYTKDLILVSQELFHISQNSV
jgi:hypothetical protein